MNNKNTSWIIAGILNVITAFAHLIGGQLELVNPLLDSNLTDQGKTEWLAAWHIVTIIIFMSSIYLLLAGFGKLKNGSAELMKFIGILYVLFGVAFIVSNIWMKTFSPQWIILLPIGILAIWGSRKN